MALNPPQRGWTALSLAPNPDLFAAAHVNIDRVSSGIVSPVATSPVTSPAPIAPAYNQLQQSIFPQLQTQQQQQLQAQQLQAAQATTAPANAFAAVEKQLKAAPWTPPTTATMPQSKFLDPAGAKAPASGWVPGVPQI